VGQAEAEATFGFEEEMARPGQEIKGWAMSKTPDCPWIACALAGGGDALTDRLRDLGARVPRLID
jgi:hypothetical protein